MQELLNGIFALSIGNVVMIGVGAFLIYIAISKEYEPALLIPIGFSTILVNIPFSSAIDQWMGGVLHRGVLSIFFDIGIITEIFPLLIFIAVGAMIDFGPLLEHPIMFLFGAAAQFGIFATMVVATLLGFDIKQAASIGIIGSADGPTSIYVAGRFAKDLLGPISVAAYSYMSLVPIIQPPVIKALTTREERRIKMAPKSLKVNKTARIIFPILVTIIASLIAPSAAALIGFLMFGNLLRECGVLNSISKTAQTELANIVTILLGLSIGSTMTADKFLQPRTLYILLLGVVAFVFDTAGGVLFAKFLNLFLRNKINPMLGAAGISAFPMSARVIHQLGRKEDPTNYLLMYAVGANVAGQIGSVLAGGILIALVGNL
ncbi:glutaconyl-CoA decarboxylase subunit beta [Fervidobacterium sp. SC_NGM5_O18]|uniref:Glutaconyl-CoA decarboxylase subunit beta n=2 Tax=Fervidobacterium pennivorans TaxID=93466 RepID=A0A172T3T0_FERPE|nr:sodium ion-translocating decarboxylase subunit beta [Fervidobacterium pennivorans]AFG35723.1 sodium ion-translocating decarboxylase, beta subunit [Fervidobacterium pennivorans DSM 9078]ANE41503.1 glutaconyl-CoA decarboxylase subunit beta [Fervidobacterium pennivorans]PHJ12903.1 glutaconyl-CoA decarboxylase subunit beta [Fervidobacterium sp. SC_NGM5_O18]